MIDLPNGWAIRSVESICERVTSGGTPSRRRPEFYTNGTIDWYKTGELRDRLLSCSEERITQEALDSSSAKIFPADTVLLALYGDGDTITTLGLLKKPGATNQACCAMIVNEQVADARYLFYALKHTRSDLLQRCVGGAQRNLSGKLVREHQIPVPPVREQRAIAAVLGCLDDKIEHNRRTSRSLEGLARAMFKAWFVDFEPVHAKAAGATAYPGMPPEAFAALPTTFTDSPLGPVPEGWGVGTLGDHCGINLRSVRKGEINGEIEYVDIASVTVGRLDAVQRMPFAEAPSRARRRLAHGDTIWSCVRPNHRSYLFIHSPPDHRLVSTGFAVLSPGGFGPSFLHELTTRQDFVDYLVANADGSAYPAVRPEHFAAAQVIVPPEGLRRAFEGLTMPFRDVMAALDVESRKLAELRDYLLPKLLSGEVRVNASEKVSTESLQGAS